MQRLYKHLNYEWALIFSKFLEEASEYNGYYEAIAFSYKFSPMVSHIMSSDSTLFDLEKAAAMYFWYKNADPKDKSIIDYFKEYEHCIDSNHNCFNSNYGLYAYADGGLNKCVSELIEHKTSRQAMFCINNNHAMGPSSIDKLCTNTIQFFIRNDKLEMIVQMRSSNFITLLPYDAFMFSVFYANVYALLKHRYTELKAGKVHMQVASLHLYEKDIYAIEKVESGVNFLFNIYDNNWKIVLETKLLTALNA